MKNIFLLTILMLSFICSSQHRNKNISSETKRSSFETYVNNEDYFIKTFDVNKDGISDKIVSNKPYQGENLFIFLEINKENIH